MSEEEQKGILSLCVEDEEEDVPNTENEAEVVFASQSSADSGDETTKLSLLFGEKGNADKKAKVKTILKPKTSGQSASKAKAHAKMNKAIVKAASAVPPSSSAISDAGKKWGNKTAEEILNPHGWKEMYEELSQAKTCFANAAFSTLLQGSHKDDFAKEIQAVKKLASSAYKSLVRLDIKVKKWSNPPERVTDMVTDQRKSAKAMMDACAAFCVDGKRINVSEMEKALAELPQSGLATPPALAHLFFIAKTKDLILFRQIEESISFIGAGPIDITDKEMLQKSKTVAIGESLPKRRRGSKSSRACSLCCHACHPRRRHRTRRIGRERFRSHQQSLR